MTADPSPKVVIAIALTLTVIVLVAVSMILASSPAGQPGARPTNTTAESCAPGPNVTFDGEVYASCNATLAWNTTYESFQQWYGVQSLANVSLRGVVFNVTGYNTMDCPVVNVTGHEPMGNTYSFLIYPIPDGCQFNTPTVLSPDHSFGATWTGGDSIQILVRDQ